MADDTTKSLWQSKTFWLAVLQIAIGIATATQQELVLGSTFTLIGFIQIILRVVTSSSIKFD